MSQGDPYPSNVEAAIVRELRCYPAARACNLAQWDDDSDFKQPILWVKASISESPVYGQPVYRVQVEITREGKPRRHTRRQADKAILDLIQDSNLWGRLTDATIKILGPAEDIAMEPTIQGDLRKRTFRFKLIGYPQNLFGA
jgi:hypothetical protein